MTAFLVSAWSLFVVWVGGAFVLFLLKLRIESGPLHLARQIFFPLCYIY